MLKELEGLLIKLSCRRATMLAEYLSALNNDDWDNNHSMDAINAAGRVHDIDRHITNVQLEIKRLESVPEPQEERSYAS